MPRHVCVQEGERMSLAKSWKMVALACHKDELICSCADGDCQQVGISYCDDPDQSSGPLWTQSHRPDEHHVDHHMTGAGRGRRDQAVDGHVRTRAPGWRLPRRQECQ